MAMDYDFVVIAYIKIATARIALRLDSLIVTALVCNRAKWSQKPLSQQRLSVQ
jgi:hypothetical protein